MNPIITSEPLGNPSRSSIIATLRSAARIFEVRCEATGAWLSPAYSSCGYRDEHTKATMRESLKKTAFQFHQVKEEGDVLWVTRPVGFWLKDGRLVSPFYQTREHTKPYYGGVSEILSMGRKIHYVSDGPVTLNK